MIHRTFSKIPRSILLLYWGNSSPRLNTSLYFNSTILRKYPQEFYMSLKKKFANTFLEYKNVQGPPECN